MSKSKIVTMLVAVSALVLASAVTPAAARWGGDGTWRMAGRRNRGWYRGRLGAGRGSGVWRRIRVYLSLLLRVWLPLLLLRVWLSWS